MHPWIQRQAAWHHFCGAAAAATAARTAPMPLLVPEHNLGPLLPITPPAAKGTSRSFQFLASVTLAVAAQQVVRARSVPSGLQEGVEVEGLNRQGSSPRGRRVGSMKGRDSRRMEALYRCAGCVTGRRAPCDADHGGGDWSGCPLPPPLPPLPTDVQTCRSHTPRRYRGVAAIVAIPVLLILTVLAVMPRGSPFPAQHDFTRSQPFSRSHYEEAGGGGGKVAAAAGDGARYAIVIDAGSTGSRIHIFKFLPGAGGHLELQFDKFDQLKPGLSSFADDPPAAARSLAPLLELAEATIPEAQRAATSIMVGATAGLRLLPDGKADLILEEVRTWLRAKPFKVGGRVDEWGIVGGK